MRIIGLAAALAILIAGNASASDDQTYDGQLKSLTQGLVVKIEKANQKSGSVLDFTDLQGQPTELGRFLAQEVADKLVSDVHSFTLVDRTNLQQLLRENKLTEEGLVNPETGQKLGRLVGIDTLIFGTVTPIGQQIVRLSVRAVAVETGKVVAAQSASLPMTAELASLYTRGVASPPDEATTASSSNDIRTRFRADSIKMVGKNVKYTPENWNRAVETFTIENLSGMGIDAAIKSRATLLGACVGGENSSAGIGMVGALDKNANSLNFDEVKTFLPAGAKVTVAVEVNNCKPSGAKAVDIAITLQISAQGQVFDIPLSASDVPVQATAKQ